MGDWAEGFANVGGIGDVAVGGEKDCADAVCVASVSIVGIGGIHGARLNVR